MSNLIDERRARIADALRVMIGRGQVVELRALDVKEDYGRPSIHSGNYNFDHIDDAQMREL